MPNFAPPVGEPPAVQFIPPARLKVDSAYQRSLDGQASRKLVTAIAERWDWRLCVPLLVAARGPELFIIDGQHRWAAAQLRGDITYLPCAVGQYGSAAEEASLFVAANRRRVAVNRLDLFRAAIAAGDEASATIDALLAGAGLDIAEHTSAAGLKPGQIASTAVLYRALQEKGPERLGHAIAMIGQAFAGQVITFSGVIIAAIVLIDPAGYDDDDRQLLLDTLSSRSADEWASSSELSGLRGGKVRADALAKVIRMALADATTRRRMALQTPPRPAPTPAQAGRRSGNKALPAPKAEGRRWCDQCERRVSPAEASICSSTFCKAKMASAA